MEIDLTLNIIIFLALAGVVAGFVDTLAGGGGLITVPALLLTGMPPINAFATNKFQGSFGTLTASLNILKKKMVRFDEIKYLFLASLIGSTIGAIILTQIDQDALRFLIPFVLLFIAAYFIFAPQYNDEEKRPAKVGERFYLMVVTPLIGAYDGLIGPGTGSFFSTAGVALKGQSLQRATAIAKFLNFASNVAALVVFIFSGDIIWLVGAIMIVGQIIGGYVGSMAIILGKTGLIRPMIIIMSLAMTAKYFYDLWMV